MIEKSFFHALLYAISIISLVILLDEFGAKRALYIREAQRVRVKGLTADALTSGMTLKDETALLTRKNMKKSFSLSSAFMYIFMGVFFAWFGIGLAQDFSIASLGWFFLRVVMMIGRALAAYLSGFEDIATRWKDTLIKKTDILREFEAWSKNAIRPTEEHFIPSSVEPII